MSIGIIIPCYNEDYESVQKTVKSCLEQSLPPEQIILIDDHSIIPLQLDTELAKKVKVIRNEENLGISASRNKALGVLKTKYAACINVEVLPKNDWLEKCSIYMDSHANCGGCYTKTKSLYNSIISNYRMRFQERPFPEKTGISDWAPGHAVFFRKSVLDLIGGYDSNLKLIHEDFEICERIKKNGFEIHFIGETFCYSIQKDSLLLLAKKQIIRNGFNSKQIIPLATLFRSLFYTSLNRILRNVIKFRWHFIPIDIAVFFVSMSYGFENNRKFKQL